MKLIFQIAGGILLALLVVLLIVGVGSIKVSPEYGPSPTATTMPDRTEADHLTGLLVSDCGISWQDVQDDLNAGLAYMPQPVVDPMAAKLRMLQAFGPALASTHAGWACEWLGPAYLASYAEGKSTVPVAGN